MKKLRDKKTSFIENKSTAFPFWTKPIGEILNLHVRENDFYEYRNKTVLKSIAFSMCDHLNAYSKSQMSMWVRKINNNKKKWTSQMWWFICQKLNLVVIFGLIICLLIN